MSRPGRPSKQSRTLHVERLEERLAPTADVGIQVFAPATVTAGTNMTYTLFVTNNGPGDASNVQVTDNLPAGVIFQNLTFGLGAPATAAAVGQNIASTTPTLLANQSLTMYVEVSAPSSDANGLALENEADLTDNGPDPNNADKSSTVQTVVLTDADVSVTQTGLPTVVTAGTQFTYTISFSNAGPSDAQSVKVTDALPAQVGFQGLNFGPGTVAGTTFQLLPTGSTGAFQGTIPAMTAGSSSSIFVTVNVLPNTPNGTTVSNLVVVGGPTADTNQANNSDTATTPILASADLAVTQTGPATVTAGTDVTYTLSLTNNGPSDAQNVTLSDALPLGEAFVSASEGTGAGTSFSDSIGTLAAGALRTVTIVAFISPSIAVGAVLHDTAMASSTTTDPIAANNSAPFDTHVVAAPAADLAVTQTGPATATAGTDVTYTLSLTNNGPNDAQNVTLSDALPLGESFVSASEGTGAGTSFSDSIGTFAAGASRTVTIVAFISPSVAAGAVLHDTAMASSTTTDPNAANNSAPFDTHVVAAPADLAVTQIGPATATAGTNVTYTLSLTNNGPGAAQNVHLTDVVPAGATFVSESQTGGPIFSVTTPPSGGTGTISGTIGSLANGASATFQIVFHANSNDVNAGPFKINNTATASSTTPDSNTLNNSSTSTALVQASADLGVAITPVGPQAIPGGDLTYDITVTNSGPSDAIMAALTDALPSNTTFVSFVQLSGSSFVLAHPAVGSGGTLTATQGTLAAGATATFQLVVMVKSTTPVLSKISDMVIVSTATSDPNSSNNSATSTVFVKA